MNTFFVFVCKGNFIFYIGKYNIDITLKKFCNFLIYKL